MVVGIVEVGEEEAEAALVVEGEDQEVSEYFLEILSFQTFGSPLRTYYTLLSQFEYD